MRSPHILVVDDDAACQRVISMVLEQVDYEVKAAASVESALALARTDHIDLILLDTALPGINGHITFLQLHEYAPIIIVTDSRSSTDEIVGLELGAADYITKPFEPNVLLARIRAVLRRKEASLAAHQDGRFVVGDLVIDHKRHLVTIRGQPIELTPLEFRLLHVLALHADQVISGKDLLTQVWGVEYESEPQAIYVYIRALRKKIEGDPHHPVRIITVWGVGYMLASGANGT
jgi:DNA-binding response OmpR family regulator